MRMQRWIVLLAVLLVLQIGVLIVQGLESGGGASTVERPEGGLLHANPEQVARIVIRDKAGKTIELVREGKGFVVKSAGNYPVEGDRADSFLKALLALEPKAVVARSERSHRGLGVAKGAAEREITLYDAGGKELGHVLLGSSGGEFARRAGEPTVYRVSDRLGYRASTAPGTWVDTSLLSFQVDDVRQVRWLRKGAKQPALAVQRIPPAKVAEAGSEAAEPKWLMTAPKAGDLERTEAESLVSALAHLRFSRPVAAEAKPEHGLTPPEMVVEIELTSGEKIRLELGARTDDNGVYARTAGKPFVVELPSYTAERILEAPDKLKPKTEKHPETAGVAGSGAPASPSAATPTASPAPPTTGSAPAENNAPQTTTGTAAPEGR
ncbi:MAG: DUF4340 domain-containing protein [Planctomycetota bacterium]|nr:MAG: DUF4340 domain-containing protein [Planctomycetota bacterium]